MEQRVKLHIDAVSPDGVAVSCKSDISIEADRVTTVSILANFFNKEPKLKSLIAEALFLSLSGEKISEPTDVDGFLDHMLKSKSEDSELN